MFFVVCCVVPLAIAFGIIAFAEWSALVCGVAINSTSSSSLQNPTKCVDVSAAASFSADCPMCGGPVVYQRVTPTAFIDISAVGTCAGCGWITGL